MISQSPSENTQELDGCCPHLGRMFSKLLNKRVFFGFERMRWRCGSQRSAVSSGPVWLDLAPLIEKIAGKV
jgi:hypothetical protein